VLGFTLEIHPEALVATMVVATIMVATTTIAIRISTSPLTHRRPITGRPFLVPLYVPHFTARSRVGLPIEGKLALLSEKGLRKGVYA
jgi:hypothetical protein